MTKVYGDRMASVEAEDRRLAVAAARDLDTGSAIEVVMQGLADPDWRVRKEAIATALIVGNVDALCGQLLSSVCQGENVGLRNAALEVFARLGGRALGCLVTAYGQVSRNDLKFIIEALGSVREPDSLPLLIEATHDSDANVAAAAIDALARVGGPEAESALVSKLDSPDLFLRMAALDALARLEAPLPWERLEPLLGDRLVRRVALSALGRCHDPRAVAPLTQALGDPSPHFVAEATVSLAHLYETDAAARRAIEDALLGAPLGARGSLRVLARDGDLAQRQASTLLLLLARDSASIEAVVTLAVEGELLQDAQEALREWGVDAIEALLDVSECTRGVTAGTALELAADLSQLGPLDETRRKRLRTAVRAALGHADPGIAGSAARSMTWFVEPSDAPALVQAALRGPEDVSRAAAHVLTSIAQTTPEVVLEALLSAQIDGHAAPHLLRVLAATRSDQAFGLLQNALSGELPETRAAAIEALGEIGGRRAAELISYALTDESPAVQAMAAEVLGTLRGDDGSLIGLDGLLLALESDVPAVQSAAAHALGAAKVVAASTRLQGLTRSTAPGVAFAAVSALGSIADPGLPDLLVETLGHRDEEVVKQALRTLSELGGERAVARIAIGLVHHSWDVRILAARLLGTDGSEVALRALRERIDGESDPMVQQAIAEALSVEAR